MIRCFSDLAVRWGSTLLSIAVSAALLSACAGDSIGDRRTGQQIVCHKESKTLTVSNADSFVHLDHGDSPGPCPEPEDD